MPNDNIRMKLVISRIWKIIWSKIYLLFYKKKKDEKIKEGKPVKGLN